MGIEQYNEGRKTPGREPNTRTGRGIEKLFEGISLKEKKNPRDLVQNYTTKEIIKIKEVISAQQ